MKLLRASELDSALLRSWGRRSSIIALTVTAIGFFDISRSMKITDIFFGPGTAVIAAYKYIAPDPQPTDTISIAFIELLVIAINWLCRSGAIFVLGWVLLSLIYHRQRSTQGLSLSNESYQANNEIAHDDRGNREAD